ncbi:MAG TPA: SWIB/MDM2 domain-containing protein [Rhabdochlamydiaceae bacterium]|jgi:DNA topoisomerase-3|nr:SWIB/MDM2 domain-containing protein [Rhabdochlamydiaceae bacterium]
MAKKKAKGKRKSGLMMTECKLSPDLAAVVGTKSATRPQVVKKIWDYIKKHKLQDPKKRRMIKPDKKLSTVLGKKPIDMLKMAGMISKHIK